MICDSFLVLNILGRTLDLALCNEVCALVEELYFLVESRNVCHPSFIIAIYDIIAPN